MRRDVAGLEVFVADDGEGIPVVLLHGNPDAHDTWDAVVRRLPGLRCVRPDMPGFGGSPEPPPSFDYLAPSTVPLWDALLAELPPAVVVVHDFGGPWLLPWVARNPDRVRGLVICNTIITPGYRWHPFARFWQTRGLGEVWLRVNPRWVFRREMRRGSRGLPVEYADACHARATPAMRRSVLRTYRSHARPDIVFRDELPRLQAAIASIPVRVVWGARDPYIDVAEASAFGVEPRVVVDVGHWVHIERPEAVADAIRAVIEAGAAPG